MVATARRFRELLPAVVPSWLREGDGGRVLYVIGALLDASTQRMRDALEARFPGRAGASALLLTGAERRIMRGRSEIAPHYAERLRRWRWPRGHRTRGNPLAWLEQVAAYWGGLEVYSVDVSGNRSLITADGTITVDHGTSWSWDAGASLGRARFWGGVESEGVMSFHPADWDEAFGGTWDPDSDYTIGQLGAAPGDALAMRRLMFDPPWKPAGSRGEWLIFHVGGAGVDPDPAYRYWSKVVAGVRVESRDSNSRYWRLCDEVNTYSGFAAQWTGATLPGSGVYYDGDPDEFPISAVGPSGTTYTGNPARFPTSVLLPDDGDHL